MAGKPQDFMRVGIVHFMAFPGVIKGEGPIRESLQAICDDKYFEAVELTTIKDKDTRRHCIKAVKDAGLVVGFGAQPIILMNKLNLNALDDAGRKKAVECVNRAIDEAYEWEAIGLAVLSGPDPGPDKRDAARKALVASMKELCAHSRTKGKMPIILETFDRKPFGKNCLIGPTSDAVEVAEAVMADSPNFGLMLDLSHLPLQEEAAETAITTAGKFLKHVHIGNCVMKNPSHPAYGDGHPAFDAPDGENGAVELAEFLDALKEAAYLDQKRRPVVSFEVKPYGDETSESVIKNAQETLDEAWELLE
jgi:sugar phosphate isomerase/epimerase